MSTHRGRILGNTIAFNLAMGAVSMAVAPRVALAGPPTMIDADGILHVPSLTIPASEWLSPEFKRAYAKLVAGVLAHPPQVPAMNAPKAEWDKVDAAFDRGLAEPLAWDLEHYPVNVVDTKMAGVHVGVITPKDGIAQRNQHRVLINLHGGGFCVGRGLVQGQVESIPIASLSGIKVITVDYREAPYDRYPAASEDVEAVYKELLKQYRPEAIGIFGGSAGGWLTAQVLAWFQVKGLPRPGAAGMFWGAPPTPPFPFRKGDSMIWGLGGFPEDKHADSIKAAVVPGAWYMGSTDSHDAAAYPGSFDTVLAQYPPTLFLSGTRAFDMSSAITAHARLLKLGVDSYLYLMEGAWHGAELTTGGTPEERDVDTYISQWFDQHLAR